MGMRTMGGRGRTESKEMVGWEERVEEVVSKSDSERRRWRGVGRWIYPSSVGIHGGGDTWRKGMEKVGAGRRRRPRRMTTMGNWRLTVQSDNDELGEGDASLASPNASEGEERGELGEEHEKGVPLEAKEVGKVAADVELTEEEKPEDEKGEEEVARGGYGVEANGKLGDKAEEASDETVAVGGEAPEES